MLKSTKMMELIEKYLRYLRYERNYSPHTEISYSVDLGQFSDFISQQHPGVDVKSVDGDVVRLWIVSLMNAGVSVRTVNRKLSALKSFYKYMLRIGEVSVNPMKKVIGPKTKKAIPSFVNYSDMEKVLDDNVVEDSFEFLRNRVMIELFYVTGMRRAELIGLHDSDIDLEGRMIRVTGKRNKQRLIPVSERTKVMLDEYLMRRNNDVDQLLDNVFVREDGRPLYPMLVHRIVTASLKWIPTLAKASPHVLRHSFATGMLNNGADINAVKELLGHSSLASTEVYTHTSFEELKKIYNKAHPRA